jgi:uncharacterized ParB-like nuclease family protein
MTTLDTITEAQICALRDEAASAGDFEQVEVCNHALAQMRRPFEGVEMIKECVRVIRNAEAQR